MQAANTLRAYQSDWKDFENWCKAQQRDAVPATTGTLVRYLSDLAAHAKVATVTRRLAAISNMYKNWGFLSPTKMHDADLKATLSRIRREKKTEPTGKVALLTADVRRLVGVLPGTVLGARDAALLLIGFAGGLRRSELAALRAEDVKIIEDGLKIALRGCNTEQRDTRRVLEIPHGLHPDTCPVRAYTRWLDVSGITSGHVFRRVNKGGHMRTEAITPQAVYFVVKRRCTQAGLDPAKFGADSLRSGLATQAALNGASIHSIMAQTGHKSVATCRRIIRDSQLLCDNAAARLGL